ncbi:MAG: cob(I)yrinic acid a,c-diamide adenosyltransferase [Syntrophomonadaceae bacterium]|nr:cob(I)yrinic acid a,c-diamide adenosyltransferase [Syntrophomonadaceae bacterium]
MRVVFTGTGKGKTTAAVGLAIRAWGHGKRVLVVAFLKDLKVSGEWRAINRIDDSALKAVSFGRTCPYRGQDCCPGDGECIVTHSNQTDEDYRLVEAGLDFVSHQLKNGYYDVIILDEIWNVYRLFTSCREHIISILQNSSPEIDIITTGRQFPRELTDNFDLITSMDKIKHPYSRGISARKGIDY